MEKIVITKRQMNKISKVVNELYDYYKITRTMPPRGDGAKLECAKEVHQLALKLFNKLESSNPNIRYATTLMLLELAEQMGLGNIDPSMTVEEMQLYE